MLLNLLNYYLIAHVYYRSTFKHIYFEEIITLSVADSTLSVIFFDILLTFIYYVFTNAPMLSNKYKYCPIANVAYKLSLTPISGRGYHTKHRRLDA